MLYGLSCVCELVNIFLQPIDLNPPLEVEFIAVADISDMLN